MAITRTITTTAARLDLIKFQIRYVLKMAAGLSDSGLDIVDKILGDKVGETFHIYGFNSSKLCRAQLDISIDWKEYGLQIDAGKSYIAIDDRWVDGASIEIQEAARTFDKFIKSNSLTREYRVTFVYGTDIYKYGFAPGSPINWSGEKQELITLGIEELPELKIGLYAAY